MARVTLNLNGGIPPYTVSVKRVGEETERFVSYFGGELNFTGEVTNENITYNIAVTDSSPVPCTAVRAFSLNCYVAPPNPDFNVSFTNPLCNPSGLGYTEASVTITNIVNGSRIVWCNGVANMNCRDCTDSNLNITNNQAFTITVGIPANTPPGQRPFTMRVYSDATCTYYKERIIYFTIPDCTPPEEPCNMSLTLGTPNCGNIPLTINNGVAPYSISVKKLNEGYERYVSYTGTQLDFQAATDNTLGTYKVIVNDSRNCTAEGTFQLQCGQQTCNIQLITGTPVCDNAICNIQSSLGTATCNGTTGTLPYNVTGTSGNTTISVRKDGDSTERFTAYSNNNVTFNSLNGNNTYTITITDSKGCIKTDTFQLNCGTSQAVCTNLIQWRIVGQRDNQPGVNYSTFQQVLDELCTNGSQNAGFGYVYLDSPNSLPDDSFGMNKYGYNGTNTCVIAGSYTGYFKLYSSYRTYRIAVHMTAGLIDQVHYGTC